MEQHGKPVIYDAVPLPSSDQPATTTQPQRPRVNVASFNTLSNWWYVYKYYHSSVPDEARRWEQRGKLMQQYIQALNADVVCLQEVRPDSFAKDFAFLHAEGSGDSKFDAILEQSNNVFMRCAICFRTDKLRVVRVHKKTRRALIVTLEVLPAGSGHQFVVATCHLSAGEKAGERVRQLEDILKNVDKQYGASAKKNGPRESSHIPLLLCGDFNSEPQEACREFLLTKKLDPTFVDPLYPDVPVTSKSRQQPFTLRDAYADAFQDRESRPNTMVVKEIFQLFLRSSAAETVATDTAQKENTDDPSSTYSDGLLKAVRFMFDLFASKTDVSDTETFIQAADVERWLTELHGPPSSRDGSGVHHERLARETLTAQLEQLRSQQQDGDADESTGDTKPVENGNGGQALVDLTRDAPPIAQLAPARLSFSDFLGINIDELNRNPWSVMYDIVHFGADKFLGPDAMKPPAQGGLPFFERVYDYMYYTPDHFRLLGVRRPMSPAARTKMLESGVHLPNLEHPSDHLPLAACLEFASNVGDLEAAAKALSAKLAKVAKEEATSGKAAKSNKRKGGKAKPTVDAAALKDLVDGAREWLSLPIAADAADPSPNAESRSNFENELYTLSTSQAQPLAGPRLVGLLSQSIIKNYLKHSERTGLAKPLQKAFSAEVRKIVQHLCAQQSAATAT